MLITSLARTWSLLDRRDSRRLAAGTLGSAVLAILDMVGVAMVFPLIILLFGNTTETVDSQIPFIGSIPGFTSSQSSALVLAAGILILFLIRGAGAILILHSTLRTTLDAEAKMAKHLLHSFLSAPLEFHISTNSASIQRTLGESLRLVYQDALVVLVPAIGDSIVVILVTVVLLFLAPVEALVGGLCLGCVVIIYRRTAGRRTEYASQLMVDKQQEALKYVQQSLAAVREIQLRGAVDQFTDDLLRVRLDLAEHQSKVSLVEFLPRYLMELGMLVSAALVGVTAFSRHPTDKAVAVLTLFVAAVLRVLPSLNRSMVASMRLIVAQPSVSLIREALDSFDLTQPKAVDDTHPISGAESFSAIDIRNLNFTYPSSERQTIQNFSLRVTRGEYLGIVGPSGSGKTTLLNLILGLLDPSDGEILVNGVRLAECRRSWQQRIGYVPQDVAFLDSSIADNVALGIKPENIDRLRVRNCLNICQLGEFVDVLEDGIDTGVREAGASLSGGQRQRIGLARALYNSPEVLILDEATSALDPATEGALLDAIDELKDDLTIIVVAHRKTTVARCDRVIEIGPVSE